MDLTNDILKQYEGGQLEVKNEIEEYIYRGEIKTAQLKGDVVDIELNWVAKGNNHLLPTEWVEATDLIYQANLQIYAVSNIGPGSEGGDRLSLSSGIVGELVILYPPNGSKFDRSKVKPA